MRRRRTLRPEEEELWQSVARTARPLRAPVPAFRPPPPEAPAFVAAPPRLSAFLLGEKLRQPERRDVVMPPGDALLAAPLQMDARTHARMTRGKLAPEARIDLHGMTLPEAHPALIRFIQDAQAAGLRLVLVITGKGRRRDDSGPIPQRTGALRHHVPQWLRLPPLGQAVLQVNEAHLTHGGAGAYYVYLRRR